MPLPLQERTRWRNRSGTLRCTPAEIHRPRSEEEIAAVVGSASVVGERVKAVGSGHSLTGVGLTDGHLLDLRGYNRLLRVNRSTLRATAQAGSTLAALSRHLFPRGLSLADTGDAPQHTLGGAVAIGTHGSGARYGCVAAQAVGLRVVTADGSAIDCSPEDDPALFQAARVGLGALGVISTVTMGLEPAFNLRAREDVESLDDLLDDLDRRVEEHEHFEFSWRPGSALAVSRSRNRTPRPADASPLWRRVRDDALLSRYASSALARVDRVSAPLAHRTRALVAPGSRDDYVDRGYVVFASERDIAAHEMEYFVPADAAREAVVRVREIAELDPQRNVMPVEVRFVAADDIPLSMCEGRASCAIAVRTPLRAPYEQYFAAIEAVMRDFDGRPHWGKLHFQSAATLRPLYPRWDEFQQTRVRVDPRGTFSNAYLDHVLGPVGA